MPNNKIIGPQAPGYAAPQKSSTTPDPGNRSTWSHATPATEEEVTEKTEAKTEKTTSKKSE